MHQLHESLGRYIKSFDGTKIYYNILTLLHSKKTLIFLHGMGGDSAAWDAERIAFHALGYSTIAIDLRGHGYSDRPQHENAYAFDAFVKDIIAVLQEEGVEKSVIIGHCFGAMIALQLEANYPSTARALVCIDTSYRAPYWSEKIADKRLLHTMIELFQKIAPVSHIKEHADTEKFIGTTDFSPRRIFSDIMHTSFKTYLYVLDKIVQLDTRSVLSKITVPTLILVGTDDSIFPPRIAEEMHKRIKHSLLDYVSGANHLIVINNPEDIVKDVYAFLKRLNYT